MTEKGKETLEYIYSYAEKNQLLPTLQEIADALYISKPSANLRLRRLEKAGYIERVFNSARYRVKGLKYVRVKND